MTSTFIGKRVTGEVNVLAFGADPTGTNDSTAAFNAAAAECKSRDFSSLYIPAGFYKIASGSNGSWDLHEFAGLRVRGDGEQRSTSTPSTRLTGTTVFLANEAESDPEVFGINMRGCFGCEFRGIGFLGATPSTGTNKTQGIRIYSQSGAAASCVTFHQCGFMRFKTAVGLGAYGETPSVATNDSEMAFYDCVFIGCVTGFETTHIQSLVHKFIGCTATNMDVMFKLTLGGNISTVGFGCTDVLTLIEAGGGGTAWNTLVNTRLESNAGKRTQFYKATGNGTVRTAFYGILLAAATGESTGSSRVHLKTGHEVHVHDARASNLPLSTTSDPFVSFTTGTDAQAQIIRCYRCAIPEDTRFAPFDATSTLYSRVRYCFIDCYDGNTDTYPVYPDSYHFPLHAPNFSMTLESHCFAVGDGLNGVTAQATAGGGASDQAPSDTQRAGVIACQTVSNGDAIALMSYSNAAALGGGTWRCAFAARLDSLATTSDNFVVRLGFGDSASGEPAYGVFFEYEFDSSGPTHKWKAQCTRTGYTAVDQVLIDADTSWHTFEIAIDVSAGTNGTATFYIDGVELYVADSTSIPRGTDRTGLMPLQMTRSAGDESPREAEIDYYRYEFRPSSPSPLYPQ